MKRRLELLGHLCSFSDPQDWLAAQNLPTRRPKKEMDRHGQERSEGSRNYEDTWYDKTLNRQKWLDACREGTTIKLSSRGPMQNYHPALQGH